MSSYEERVSRARELAQEFLDGFTDLTGITMPLPSRTLARDLAEAVMDLPEELPAGPSAAESEPDGPITDYVVLRITAGEDAAPDLEYVRKVPKRVTMSCGIYPFDVAAYLVLDPHDLSERLEELSFDVQAEVSARSLAVWRAINEWEWED